jgi:plastocyanin
MFGKSRARHLGLLGAAVVSGAVVAGTSFFSAGTAGAAQPRTINVTFGDNGASPEVVRMNAGDTVAFVNKVTQTGSLALADVTGQVQSASVTVNGAAQQAISLPHFNSLVTVTYPTGGTVKYTADYTYTLLPLLGSLAPSTRKVPHTGTLAIAAAPVQQPAQPNGGQQPAAPGGGSAGGGAASPAQPQAPARQQGSVPQRQGGTQFTPQGPSVADRTVPHGQGATGPATDARPQVPLGNVPPAGSALPDLPSEGTQTVLTGSAPNAGMGVPAILAVVLLSVVTAALVRALITQRRTAAI